MSTNGPVTDPELIRRLEASASTTRPGPVTDPELIQRLEGGAEQSIPQRLWSSVKDLGQDAVDTAREMQAEYGGVGGPERMALRGARGIAAGALNTIAGAGTTIGGILAAGTPYGPVPQLGLKVTGEKLAEISNEASNLIDKHIAVEDPNLYEADKLANGLGSISTFWAPGMKVAQAIKAAGAGGKAAVRVARITGATVMGAIESAVEQSELMQKLMNDGMSAEQASLEAGKIFAADLPATTLTNLGYFHPMGRVAAAVLQGAVDGLQESYQAAVQDWASGTPAAEVAEKFFAGAYLEAGVIGLALGGPLGALSAGAVADAEPLTSPKPKPTPQEPREPFAGRGRRSGSVLWGEQGFLEDTGQMDPNTAVGPAPEQQEGFFAEQPPVPTELAEDLDRARGTKVQAARKVQFDQEKALKLIDRADKKERAELDARAQELGFEDAYEAIRNYPAQWPSPQSEAQQSRSEQKKAFKLMPSNVAQDAATRLSEYAKEKGRGKSDAQPHPLYPGGKSAHEQATFDLAKGQRILRASGHLPQGGVLQVPSEVSEDVTAAIRVGQALGIRVVPYNAKSAPAEHAVYEYRGFYSQDVSDTIFISAKPRVGANHPVSVFAHELAHLIEKEHPDIYSDLVAAADGNVTIDRFRLFAAVKGQNPAYKLIGKKRMFGELMGESFAQASTSERFWSALAEVDKGLFKRLARLVRSMIDRVRNSLHHEAKVAPLYRDFAKMEKAIAKAMLGVAKARAGGKRTGPPTPDPAKGAAWFSHVQENEIDNKYGHLGSEVTDALKRDVQAREQLDHDKRKGIRHYGRDWIYKQLWDDLTWIHRRHREALERHGKNWFDEYEYRPERNPYFIAHMTRQTGSEVINMWKYGIPEFGNRENIRTRGAEEILADVGDLQLFQKLQEQLTKIMYDKHKGAGFVDPEVLAEATKIRDAILKEHKGWQALAEEWSDFENKFLEFVSEAGGLDPELVEWLKLNYKLHVPLYKMAMLDENGNLDKKRMRQVGEVHGGSANEKAGTLIGRKGKIEKGTVYVPPLEATLNNMMYMLRASYLNWSKIQLAKEAKRLNDKELAAPVVPSMKKVEINKDELDKIIDTTGWHKDDIKNMSTLWRISEYQHKGVLSYREGGKTKYMKVDELVWEAYKDLGHTMLPAVMEWASKSTKMLRFGITSSPDFITRNGIRDHLTSSVIGKSVLVPFADSVWSFWQILEIPGFKKRGKAYKRFVGFGGGQATLTGADITKLTKQARAMAKISKGRMTIVSRLPSIAMGIASQLDNISRLPQTHRSYKKYLKRVKQGKMTLLGAQLAAGREGRYPSIDFLRAGRLGRQANKFHEFFNAAMQGVDIAIRYFGQPGMPGKGRRWSRAVSLITLPSVMLWILNHDEDWYKDKPRWQKDLFWMVSLDGGISVMYIPKPFEIGLFFGSLPERVLDFVFKEDPRAIEEWEKNFIDKMVPINMSDPVGLMPTPFARSIAHWRANKDPWGRDIVPWYKQGRDAELQYDEYTSEVAKILGKLTKKAPLLPGLSPMKIDQFLKDNFGTIVDPITSSMGFVIGLVNPSSKRKRVAERKLAGKIPVRGVPALQSLVRVGPERSSRYRIDFNHYARKADQARQSLKFLIDESESKKKIRDFIEENVMWLQADRFFKPTRSKLREANQLEGEVTISAHFTPKQKRKYIDRINKIANDESRTAVEQFEYIMENASDTDMSAAIDYEFKDAMKKAAELQRSRKRSK